MAEDMAGCGGARTIAHPRTGEVIEFLDRAPDEPDVLAMLVAWPERGLRVAEHVHPEIEETWHVLDGHVTLVVAGARVEAGPGTTVVVPPGERHQAWSTGAARLRLELTPGLRYEQFVRRCFAGEDPLRLTAEFRAEFALPTPTGHERRRERRATTLLSADPGYPIPTWA